MDSELLAKAIIDERRRHAAIIARNALMSKTECAISAKKTAQPVTPYDALVAFCQRSQKKH